MNRLAIFEMLGVPPRELLVTDIRIEAWGQTLLLSCIYDIEERQPFELEFTQCQTLRWEIIDDEDDLSQEKMADVIAITFSEGEVQREAVILTVLFEIVVGYKTMRIHKDW